MTEADLFFLRLVSAGSDRRISSHSHAVYGMFYPALVHTPPLCDRNRRSVLLAPTGRPGSAVGWRKNIQLQYTHSTMLL